MRVNGEVPSDEVCAIMTIKSVIQDIHRMDDGKWEVAMDEAGDYHHLDTLTAIKHGVECPNWRVLALHVYMTNALAQRD